MASTCCDCERDEQAAVSSILFEFWHRKMIEGRFESLVACFLFYLLVCNKLCLCSSCGCFSLVSGLPTRFIAARETGGGEVGEARRGGAGRHAFTHTPFFCEMPLACFLCCGQRLCLSTFNLRLLVDLVTRRASSRHQEEDRSRLLTIRSRFTCTYAYCFHTGPADSLCCG